jgi:surfeit locus 1 family protein
MTTDAPARRSGLPVGLTVATALSMASLMALGVWQLQRLAWKQDLLARIAALQSAPAKPIDTVLVAGAKVDFARVTATCPGLATAPFVTLYSLVDGKAGVRIISTCPLTSGPYGSVLVDRGFIADPEGDNATGATTQVLRPPVAKTVQTAPVTGVLRQPDKATFVTPAPQGGLWYSRDVPAMAKALGAVNPAPVMLFAETATNPQFAALQPLAVPAEITNRHMEYALTWFGLAAALFGVYVAVIVRGRRI